MLDDLGCPAVKFLALFLPGHIVKFHFDIFISERLSGSFEGKTALLRLVWRILVKQYRIKHYYIHKAHADNDRILSDTDHIRGVLRRRIAQPYGGFLVKLSQ